MDYPMTNSDNNCVSGVPGEPADQELARGAMVGGSNGLDPSLLARADSRWSLGPLTLPHELARVVVFEQLYRAFTILRGEPYHKGSRV